MNVLNTYVCAAVLVLAVLGCSNAPPEDLAGPWRDAQARAVEGFAAGWGDDDHCDQGSVSFIEVPRSLLVPEEPDEDRSVFIRDPQGAYLFDLPEPRTYASEVTVPPSAHALGVQDPAGTELWYDDVSEALYLLDPSGSAQRLPRGNLGCD